LQKKVPDLNVLLNQQSKFKGFRANFIATANAQFTGASGSSREISNNSDLALLKKLRSLSDLIVTDAATARAENYRPSKLAPIEVWSVTGNFAGVDSNLKLQKVRSLDESLAMVKSTYDSVLLETGPTLTGLIGELQAIDQLKLTIVGASNGAAATSASVQVKKRLNLEYLTESDVYEFADCFFFSFDR
jgi:riboflavin biosynthesis pyrimidine reductase